MKSEIITLFMCCFVLTAINVCANDSTARSNPKKSNNDVGWVLAVPNPKFYIISEFVIPDGLQLHIKIWKNGKETMDYYEYIPGQGIKNGTKFDKYPKVDALCCIKYGGKGTLNPYSIDLNKTGLTDLPGCDIENTDSPPSSLKVNLPDKYPDVNI